jgi:Flp pilus assembly protein TadD
VKRAEFEELKGEILETAEEISVDIKTESKQSTALEVAKQFAELESIQEVKQARGVYKTIISELDVEPSLELVAATKNAIIYFGDNEKTALIGALALNELIQSGDIRANDSLSDMEIDSIDAYRELAENWGIDFKNIREVSKALGITEHVVGLELIRSISEALEESSDARNVLFSLGLIDQETLNKENSIDNNQEHGDIEEVYDDFEDDPQYWEELEEEEENNSDSNATTETEANIDDLDI